MRSGSRHKAKAQPSALHALASSLIEVQACRSVALRMTAAQQEILSARTSHLNRSLAPDCPRGSFSVLRRLMRLVGTSDVVLRHRGRIARILRLLTGIDGSGNPSWVECRAGRIGGLAGRRTVYETGFPGLAGLRHLGMVVAYAVGRPGACRPIAAGSCQRKRGRECHRRGTEKERLDFHSSTPRLLTGVSPASKAAVAHAGDVAFVPLYHREGSFTKTITLRWFIKLVAGFGRFKRFSQFFGRSPDRLGLEDVRAFQVYLGVAGYFVGCAQPDGLRASLLLRRDTGPGGDTGADRLCPHAAQTARDPECRRGVALPGGRVITEGGAPRCPAIL